MNRRVLRLLHDRTAELAVGPSTVRNQGAPGVVGAARQALKELKLASFRQVAVSRFSLLLDRDTERIRKRLPRGARNWGAARKCLNIFLRDVLYNYYLCEHYEFTRLESVLELPLDKDIATGLKSEPEGSTLPRWDTIKRLRQEISDEFQLVADKVGRRRKLERVHLDMVYWRRQD